MSVYAASALAEALTRLVRANPGRCAARLMRTELVLAWRDALADPARPAPWVTQRR
ncbi:hypothetical protein LRP67_08490 [Nocardioides sp. cx-169]|uniref:hypothetical protein n=1 Tax=Nocardioides sp. cx-169 TaxID=2899080 RepID=UPI001E4D3AFC|nr:hypothetical protein [Nocardioides sp. cx-169]MCD4534115.1 hypothetical protein [Nocardioides sp. cx-169]